MQTRVLIGTLLVGALAAATLAAAPTRRAAVVTFIGPTIVAGALVMGPVVFEHDDEKMARGESCTTIYRYDRNTKQRGEVIVDFMCMPRERPLATKFEATCARAAIAGPDRLMEYQFSGEREGHGVPYSK
jgi:hypothetical protein